LIIGQIIPSINLQRLSRLEITELIVALGKRSYNYANKFVSFTP
jgi:hypothetical protein